MERASLAPGPHDDASERATPTGSGPRPSPSDSQALATSATAEEAQAWRSQVVSYKLRAERVIIDGPAAERMTQFRLTCELASAIPSACLVHSEFLCLSWPLGGVWKIHSIDEERLRVTCLAYKKEDASSSSMSSLLSTKEAQDPGKVETVEEPSVFGWQLRLGEWEKSKHWFLGELSGPSQASASSKDVAADAGSRLSVRLLAGFSPAEVRFTVNSITAVTTVEQTFEADVSWEITFPAITTMRDDSALREFLDVLEFYEKEFELSNMHDTHTERPIVSKFIPAGRVSYTDVSKPDGIIQRRVYHLQRSQRVTGILKEEMTLHHFPFDQQKLSFTLNMSRGLGPILLVKPAPVDTASFAIQNFKLSNVFDVVYGDKVFVGDVNSANASKVVRFELVLERRSEYYLTNVALPAAIITYLSFITYAPVEGGGLMDLSSRLQIVSTLLLTCVTFKYNVASQIPQVSYFTLLDTYVFVCFVITCAITLENALFPLLATHIGFLRSANESPLLWISFGLFTLVNVVWGLYLYRWIKQRRRRSKELLRVYEYVRVMARAIPAAKKREVLDGYLVKLQIPPKDLPEIATSPTGDLFVQLPTDLTLLLKHSRVVQHDSEVSLFRKQALRDLPDIQEFYRSEVTAEESATASPASVTFANSPVASPSPSLTSPYQFASSPASALPSTRTAKDVAAGTESGQRETHKALEVEPGHGTASVDGSGADEPASVVVVNVQPAEPSSEPEPARTQDTETQ